MNEMTAEDLTSTLEVLEAARPGDTALRLALCLELLHRATTVEGAFEGERLFGEYLLEDDCPLEASEAE